MAGKDPKEEAKRQGFRPDLRKRGHVRSTFDGRDGSLWRYRTADPTSAIVGLADALRTSGARLNDLRLKRPSLEDVYLQLIAEA